MLSNVGRDLRYGFRVLMKTPAFTAIAVASLAIGIGATTAIFSLVDTILLRMLPVRDPQQLVIARWTANKDPGFQFYWRSGGVLAGRSQMNVFSWQIFSEMRSRSQTLSETIGFSPLGQVNVTANGEARIAGGLFVSGNYFSGLGVATVLGRPILADDDNVNGSPAAVIGYKFWERAFGQDPNVIGKTIYVNRQPCVVVGATPREFFGVSAGGFFRAPEIDVTLPIRAKEVVQGQFEPPAKVAWFAPASEYFWIQIMGRLRTPGGEPAASAELTGILVANLPPVHDPQFGAARIELDPGSQGIQSLKQRYRNPLVFLMEVTGLTLLMDCANLAGLLMARATTRRKEISLRLALGAGRWRLVRQLLCESAVVSAGGALAGFLLAWWGVHMLLSLVAAGPSPIPLDIRPDARILGFTAGISVITTLLFGLAPALRATRVDLAQSMKGSAPPTAGFRRFGPVRALVTVQIAMALLLVAGATLLTRSLVNLRSLPLGFDPRNVVVFGISPAASGYDESRGNDLYARFYERLSRIPGVTGVTLSTSSPISGWMSNSRFVVDGADPRKPSGSYINSVGPGFLDVMRIPLVMGRDIERGDLSSAQKVAVINETAARRYFGTGSPVGQRFRWIDKPQWDYLVIGLAKDAKYDRLRGDFPPTVYIPYTQRVFGWPGDMQFEVRTAGRAVAAVPAIRAAVRELDRMLPLMDVKTLETQIDDSLSQERLFAFVANLFGAVTLALACVGLYGLVAYSVASRTREIGVRMALGSSRAGVLRTVLMQVFAATAAGLAIGVPAALALKRVIRAQLFAIEPDDPVTLLVAAAAVAAAALLAAYLPARRALRIDPMRALHYE